MKFNLINYPTLVILFPLNSRHFNALLLLIYEQSSLAPSSPIYMSDKLILAAFLSCSSNDCNELDINFQIWNNITIKIYFFIIFFSNDLIWILIQANHLIRGYFLFASSSQVIYCYYCSSLYLKWQDAYLFVIEIFITPLYQHIIILFD